MKSRNVSHPSDRATLAALNTPIPLAELRQQAAELTDIGARQRHLLVILPTGLDWHGAPQAALVKAALARQGKDAAALAKAALNLPLPNGGLSSWTRLDPVIGVFETHASLRRALQTLFDEHPARLDIAVYGDAEFKTRVAAAAVYVAWVNGRALPNWKKDPPATPLGQIVVHGVKGLALTEERAIAEGGWLTRQLAWLPPNYLNPTAYRAYLRTLARHEGWRVEEYDLPRLAKLGAGAFLAVAQGSPAQDAAIVRLSYRGAGGGRKPALSLVGKGICFDTGGHNLKPARYMHNMHDDMNGSAVALGILLAATRLRLAEPIEVWLAIAENHLSPAAYRQNEVVRALNGDSIEIVHTDAEGRMVLADTLTLAARARPRVIIDFATLTGSMAMALGERMSGALANRDELAQQAVAAGWASGERVVAFPMPADYDEALESQVADVKQCTLDGEADHILAARFLSRFVGDTPWLHLDLSATRCKGGLGAAATEVTGFGVGLGVKLLGMLGGR